ncbi:MAG: hypothetical protein RQ824_10240 [bacterium]|nr:hypothetical protein [bacterium]
MKKILLVNDSHFFIQAMSEFLTRSGNSILTASCGKEAIKTYVSLGDYLK